MKNKTFKCFGLLAGSLTIALSSLAHGGDVVAELAERPEFSTLVTAVTEAGLGEALSTSEDITVFAPSNAAFAQIPAADLEALLSDKKALTDLLLYHVAPEKIRFRSLEDGPLDTLLEDNPVDIEVTSYGWFYKMVKVDEARITRANIRADNGVIHRINRVLDPAFAPLPSILEIATGNQDFSILADLLSKAGYAKALDNEHLNLTVFAPTNAAFEALGQETLDAVAADRNLLRKVLRNHLSYRARDSGEIREAGKVRTLAKLNLTISENGSLKTGLGVDGKPIDAADIKATNGIVHVVGEVLLPPTPKSLVDVAQEQADLSTFVTALDAAGLVETFDSTRKWPAFTIFAPDNAAFEALPEGALESLLADPEGALAEILKLHVVRGNIDSSRLYDGQILNTFNGDRLSVSIDGDVIKINNATVGKADLKAQNGIIHVMEDVIASDPYTIADLVGEKSFLSTLDAALEAADLKGALDDPEAELTLFAPWNGPFNRLPKGTVESLLADPGGDLTQILLYHVVGEGLSRDQLGESSPLTTLQGADLEITREKRSFWGWRSSYELLKVNGNRVFTYDLETDNGNIHLIDGVLLPPASE